MCVQRVLLQPGQPGAGLLPAPQDERGRHHPRVADRVLPPRARAHGRRAARAGRHPRLRAPAARGRLQGAHRLRAHQVAHPRRQRRDRQRGGRQG